MRTLWSEMVFTLISKDHPQSAMSVSNRHPASQVAAVAGSQAFARFRIYHDALAVAPFAIPEGFIAIGFK